MFSIRHLLLFVQFVYCVFGQQNKKLTLDVLMPNVAPQTKDTYLCHKFKLDQENFYITEFHPNSSKDIAHHMLLFGCEEPGSEQQDVWNCGEMSKTVDSNLNTMTKKQYESGPVCNNGGKQTILYAWAMDAPKLILPKDVSFKVGKETPLKYLVLQVHYANVDMFKDHKGHTDNSGLILKGQTQPTVNTAGVYLLETGGYIKPQEEEYFESACTMNEDIVIYPFAYRTHTHKLGVVNTGYVVKTNPSDPSDETWTELGRRSPQLPQMFFPINNAGQITVNKGDVLAARCTMRNTKDKVVAIGPTGDDEMCNFYIMYYVKGDQILDSNLCATNGPPFWSFASFFKDNQLNQLNLNAIPDDISQVPSDQEMELMSEMDQHNMKEMSMTENDENEIDADDEEKLNEILERLVNEIKEEQVEDEKESGEEMSQEDEKLDEYEAYLNKLQKEEMEKKLVDRLLKQNL